MIVVAGSNHFSVAPLGVPMRAAAGLQERTKSGEEEKNASHTGTCAREEKMKCFFNE
jgi:hypothetical protein